MKYRANYILLANQEFGPPLPENLCLSSMTKTYSKLAFTDSVDMKTAAFLMEILHHMSS